MSDKETQKKSVQTSKVSHLSPPSQTKSEKTTDTTTTQTPITKTTWEKTPSVNPRQQRQNKQKQNPTTSNKQKQPAQSQKPPQQKVQNRKVPNNDGRNPPRGGGQSDQGVPPLRNPVLPPINNNAPPENPPQVPVQPPGDIAKWARDYVLHCPNNTEIIKFMKENNWAHQVQSYTSFGYHPISHISRTKAVLSFLAKIGKGRVELNVCDFYGSQRNLSLTPQKRYPNLSVNWLNYAPSVIEGDQARGFARTQVFPHSDVVLIQDVYQDGHNPITPTTVIELARRVTLNKVFIICRLMIGEAGCDEFPEEGIWVRDKDSRIVFSPDTRQSPYAPSADLNWLIHRGIQGLDIAHVASLGPYELFECSPTPFNAIPLYVNLVPPPAMVSYRTIEYPNLAARLHSYWLECRPKFIFGSEVDLYKAWPVHNQVYEELTLNYSAKPLHGLMFDSAIQQVSGAFSVDPLMRNLQARFPNYYHEILWGTTLFLLYGNRQEISSTMWIAQKTFSPVNERIVSSRSRTTEYPQWTYPQMAVASLGTLLIGYLLWKNKGNIWSAVKQKFSMNSPLGNFIQHTVDVIQNAYHDIIEPRLETCSEIVENLTNQVNDSLVEIRETSFFDILQAGYIRYKNSPNPIKNLTYHAIFLAPIYEELFRGTILNFILGIECLGHLANVAQGHYVHIGPIVMHAVNTFLPLNYFIRVGIHSTWNTVASIHMFCSLSAYMRAFGPIIKYLEQNVATGSIHYLISLIAGFVYCAYRYFTSRPKPKPRLFNQLLEARKECLDLEITTPQVEKITPEDVFPATIAQFKRRYTLRPDLELKMSYYGQTITLAQTIMLLEINHSELPFHPVYIYPILGTNAMMYRPQPCFQNDLVALCERTWNDPFINLPQYSIPMMTKQEREEADEQRHKNWAIVAENFLDILELYPPCQLSTTIEEAAKLMGKKGKRMTKSYIQSNDFGDPPDEHGQLAFSYKKSVNLKNDEVIAAKFIPAEQRFDIKPRAIINFDPEFLSKRIAVSRDVTSYLHNIFSIDKVYRVGDFNVRFVFASGSTGPELTSLGRAMLELQEIVVLVAGDDSYCSAGRYADVLGFKFLEADQTKYDHTQDQAPCHTFDKKWMDFALLPKDYILSHLDHVSKKYKVKKKFGRDFIWRLSFDAGTQMPSGSDATTYLNSIHCIAMYHFYFYTRSSNEVFGHRQNKSFEETATYLGFTVKAKFFTDFHAGTFLKGWWMPQVNEGPIWLPLPSAMLKLGKMLVNPTSIAKGPGSKDPYLAIQQCAYALAKSPGLIPNCYPILGPFIQKLLDCSVKTDLQLPDRFKKIKVEEIANLDIPYVTDLICDRYQLTKEQVDQIHQLINQITQLPMMLYHPAFLAMRDVDYG